MGTNTCSDMSRILARDIVWPGAIQYDCGLETSNIIVICSIIADISMVPIFTILDTISKISVKTEEITTLDVSRPQCHIY